MNMKLVACLILALSGQQALAKAASCADVAIAEDAVRILSPISLPVPKTGELANPKPESAILVDGRRTVMNVSEASLTPVLPPAGMANGTAVIIAPGGGYQVLAIDLEGFEEARWLAQRGISAFVLKYRLKPSSGDLKQMVKEQLAHPTPADQSAYVTYSLPAAVLDGQEAVRLLRQRAAEYGVDREKVGMMGFSAGAITALKVATATDIAARPAFVAAIYPPLETIVVPADAPPLYGIIALDDELFSGRGFGLIEAWQAVKRPVEFHLFERGGHGFGMGRVGTTTETWIEGFYQWLRTRNLAPAPTR